MSTNVAFDNNFLDAFHDAGEDKQSEVYSCIGSGALEFFATREMILELLGAAGKPETRARVTTLAPYVLRLTGSKVLNPMLYAQEFELRGPFQLLMADDHRNELIRFIEEAAQGNISAEAERAGREALQLRKQSQQWFRAWHADIISRTKEQSPEEKATASFEAVQEKHWNNTGRRYVLRLCKECGIDNAGELADRVMADPARYPHIRFHQRVFNVMTHRYFIEQASKGRGDLFDLWQITYMVDVDVFITNEYKLPEWYRDAFGPKGRVMDAETFLSEKWC